MINAYSPYNFFFLVPIYDGQYELMNLMFVKSYSSLLRFDDELLEDDIVWIGFFANKYYNEHQGANFVSFNIS